ncbi:glycosyltransferase [Lichenihabitans sp. PAMC28606]|uniref:glycosyltransferase n=1 Tax=Lichenihabitans sp. PAMC28606 TaxID=2880932 RepID=UPI001D0BE30B|nr:glycosyltransferase [Lichenihabitans sp. PAMC28606]UDL94078.1 glycosyltransferase [Lichenihabitans sp. PAMC28606]
MKILIASTPATGHLNPLLSIARMLVDDGHEIVGLSSTAMRSRIKEAGAAFRAFPPGADFDLRTIETLFPELKAMPTGPEMVLFYMRRVFFDAVPAQHAGLQDVLRTFPADVILGDNFMYGTFPMLLRPRSTRPPIALCGTMFLHMERDDRAPNFAGLQPAADPADIEHYSILFQAHDDAVFEPARVHLNELMEHLGAPALTMNIFDASVRLPDAFMQLTVPGFEFPRQQLPSSVRFVGTPPIIPNQVPLPEWADDLDGLRKVVLVTQGTFSNHNFDQLIGPTMSALASEPDLLVIVTTGGGPMDSLRGPIPDNVRVAAYLPLNGFCREPTPS